jgi:hypothetical protein
MAERDPVNSAAIVAHIRRATPEEGESAECKAAIDTLCFLEERCQELDADPGPSAHLAILDLASALIAFGAVRGVDELIAWLRKEAPARARELAVGVSKAPLPNAPPSACLRTPQEAPGTRPEFRRSAPDRTTPPGALRSPA